MDFSKLDRRVIFGIMALAVIIPMFFNINLPVQVTEDTQEVYNAIDSLSAGEYIMISFDFEASSYPEMRPLAEVILNQAFEKDLKVVGLALFSEGTAIGYTLMKDIAKKYGRVYGEDWIYLGFRPQYVAAILGMGESIPKVFPEDYLKKSLDKYPAFSTMASYREIPLVVSIADGSLPIHWAEYANARYGQRVAVATAAVMVTAFKPYFEAQQLVGPVAGIKGAAEYEKLEGYIGPAHRRLFTQSVVHVVIILLVVGANISAYVWRRK